jgi:hypothetical protein
MSIGNLKDYGNKGNNFPWQLKMLKGLQGIINAIASLTNINIIGPLGQRTCNDSVSTTLCTSQANVPILPGINTINGLKDMAYYTGATAKLLTLSIYNQDTTVSILVSTDGGTTYVSIPSKVTINYDAGGLLNYFDSTQIFIDSNGATLDTIIIYTYTL